MLHDSAPNDPPADDPRVLVFIVAYEAERHLPALLGRIPAAVWENPRHHVLVIDDASADAGLSAAEAWAKQRGIDNLTLLRNPVNQGYGGNQKLGYRLAVEAGFDFVVLLHGDGQYAPELLPTFIDAWKSSGADVVLGSRMKTPDAARAGGMPLKKRLGNRLLTAAQNRLTGRTLSEYHTGYRGYSTALLRKVPFELNTNDFHFDTEILLQAMHVDAKFVEFAIPTHYGDEICRVNSLAYGLNVLKSTGQFALHRVGMLCSLKYRNLEPARYQDKTFMLYSSHAIALGEVRRLGPKTLLDIGCGPGFIAERCGGMGVEVTGLDVHPPLPGKMAHFRRMDLERDAIEEDPSAFDAILLLDVIEHLADPEAFLLDLRNRAAMNVGRRPAVVISTPNVAFAAVRLNLLLGRFPYAERGILDVTHKRLFTRSSLLRTLRDCGYEIEAVRAAAVPFGTVMGGRKASILGKLAAGLAKAWPTMFAFQFVVTCRPKPGVRQLLAASERRRVADDTVAGVLDRGTMLERASVERASRPDSTRG